MDGPAVDPRILARSLKFIRIINSLLGYTRATLGHFKHFSSQWKPGQRVTILDVATGSADIPRSILSWSEMAGFDVRIVGVDRHAETSAIAAEQTRGQSQKLAIVRGDALRLPFGDASFDYAMTNMFLHHLDEEAIVQVLREMDRVARRGVIVAELIRNRRAYFWISLFTVAANPMVRHDARVSVAQAFNREEVLSLRDRANIRYAEYHEHSAHRFTLAGVKPIEG
jgi:2-polyprenyl-3-methyl-5-hydroxy-6-metoxy-1,4-benzoquinol methylase